MSDAARASRGARVAAIVLCAGAVLGSAWVALPVPPHRREAGPEPEPEPVEGLVEGLRSGDGAYRFSDGTRRRVAALRDRLARGLLRLQGAGGAFPPIPGARYSDPTATAEATGLALAALCAARRMGTQVRGVPTAVETARAALRARQTKTGRFGAEDAPRLRSLSALACVVLGLVAADAAEDAATLDRAAERLAAEWDAGRIPNGWPRGACTMATLALVETGRGKPFGAAPLEAIQVREPDTLVDARDARVAEALARRVRAPDVADPFPATIFEKVLEDGVEWGGERTDLATWCLRAWLAARVPGGEAWFEAVLPGLEGAVDADDRIPGDFYGNPAARTAAAVLILYEGVGRPPALSKPGS